LDKFLAGRPKLVSLMPVRMMYASIIVPVVLHCNFLALVQSKQMEGDEEVMITSVSAAMRVGDADRFPFSRNQVRTSVLLR
jgi:hypothetical protein